MTALGYVFALLYGIACLLISFFAHKAGVSKSITRKIVHILVGFEWVILYHTVGVSVHFLLVCVIFTLLLAFTYKNKLFSMISSDGDNAPGTVYYGLSMSAMAVISLVANEFVFCFGIAVFCTSFGDGFAGLFGSLFKKLNVRIYKSKTLVGSAFAFLLSFISSFVFSSVYGMELKLWQLVCISLFATGLELITERGLDNITLPIGTSLLTYILLYADGAENYVLPVVLTPFIIALVLSRGVLTKKGVFFAVILDFAVTVSLGTFGFTLLFAFLALSAAIDKIKVRFKGKEDTVTKKTGARDGAQVIANGMLPAIFAILYLITDNFVFVIAYNTALAAAFADTAASGIGMISKKAFDPFRMKRVNAGISGGMSLLGTASSLVAPFAFLLISLAFRILDVKLWLLCASFAFSGALFDSLLGSLAQVKFKCRICGEITEKELHCEEKTDKISGIKIINNDAVNFISCLAASLLSIAAYILTVA